MPLQNRVDPFGKIHAVAARGKFTGNRGVIHDPETKTLTRRWTTKAWIVCECDFGGRRREVMGRNSPFGTAGWTELFFLDEVTALAAGHRPCFYCRRERAKAYFEALARGLGRLLKAPEADALLHRERLAAGAPPLPLTARQAALLPDGAMVAVGEKPYAVRSGAALPWSFSGYGAPEEIGGLGSEKLVLLTPATSIAALRAEYRPAWAQGAAPA